jgi:Glycosyl transferase family 2
MTLELTIVVPAFNEAHRLAEGMKRFDAAVGDGAVDLERTEVVVIDDGSADGTTATARSLLSALPHHRVVRLPENRGKGAAVRTGVGVARSRHVAFMDADMAIDPRAIPQLISGLDTNDLVVGSRALPDSMVESTYAIRSVMGRLFNRLVTTGTGLGLEDTQCGFKAFRTPVARLLFHLVRIDRFAFDVEILTRARRLGMRIGEVPVQWRHVFGSSVHPLHDSIAMLSDVGRSRLGLVATPTVPGVVVGNRSRAVDAGAAGGMTEGLTETVQSVVSGSLDGTPMPVVAVGGSTLVLLPLVGPADCAVVLSALRAELAPLPVSRQAMSLDDLAGLGPLAGRLDAPPAPEGTV